jgi:Pyridoxamine 5'-phosphate oxidase
MSKFYTAEHRALQDKFDTRRVAEMMENRIVHSEFAEQVRAFIESLDMFFLSTVDAFGRPIGSYKGGAPDLPQALIAGPETSGHSTRCDPATRSRNGPGRGRRNHPGSLR